MNTPITEEQIEVLQRIRRNIRRSEKEYALYFVECNLPNLRRQLIGKLDNTDNLKLLTLDIANYPKNKGIHIDEWVHKQKNKHQNAKSKQSLDGINIVGLEQLLPTGSDEQIIKTVSELNWRRSYFQTLKVPVIFWLPSYALELLATQASDFYDWYSDIYHFDSNFEQKKLAASNQLQSLKHPDSNISAQYYQNSTEKEIELRKLRALLDETISLSDQAYLKLKMAELFFSMGQLNEAFEILKSAENLAVELGNEFAQKVILNNISQIYRIRGQYGKALQCLEKSISICKKLGVETEMRASLNNIAQLYEIRGDYNLALKNLMESLKISIHIEDKIGICVSKNNIAGIYYNLEDYDTALKYLNESLELSDSITDKSGMVTSLNNIARIYDNLDDSNTALDYFNRALKISRDIGDVIGESTILGNIGLIHFERSNLALSLEYFENSLSIAKSTGDVESEGMAILNISQIHKQNGQIDLALEYMRKALKISKELGNKIFMAHASYNLGITLQDMGRGYSEESKTHLIYAYETAKEVGVKSIIESFK